MWLDLIAIGLLVLFAVLGIARGTLASALQLVTLGGSYALAIMAAPRFGPMAAERLQLPEMFGMGVAGAAGFAVGIVVLGALSTLLRWIERKRLAGRERSPLDRMGGGLLGLTKGGAIVLLLGWLGLWLQAAQVAGTLPDMIPDSSDSTLAEVTSHVVEAGAGVVMGDDAGSRVAARLASRPAETIATVQGLLDNPHILDLQSDEMFWTHVQHGALDNALNQASFLGIAYDDTLRSDFARVGMIHPSAAIDPKLFRAAVRDVLAEVAPRLQGLKDRPEMRALASDPEIVQALQNGDTLALLRHPAFRQLVDGVLSSPSDI